jgi:uncharacterized surface protein with fasciclin (FAS1) repeats
MYSPVNHQHKYPLHEREPTGIGGIQDYASLFKKSQEVIKIKDIVDTALGSEDFATLCKAVNAAGLVKTLRGEGPFTVFAPTNDAFAKLPPGTVEALLKDKAKLTSILTYHVVPGKMMVADFKRPKTVKTVQGQDLKIDGIMWHIRKYIKVDGAKTVKTDIEATNGVIHAIDSVLMPK